MMRVTFDSAEILRGLDLLKKELDNAMTPLGSRRWQFPGWPSLKFRSWQKGTTHGTLTVGIGDSPRKNPRRLIMLACEGAETSTAEVNIPLPGHPDPRRVSGCLLVDSNSNFWLGRGFRFIYKAHQTIPLDFVREYFIRESDWLQDVDDGGKERELIIIAQIGPGLPERLAKFAYEVDDLKTLAKRRFDC